MSMLKFGVATVPRRRQTVGDSSELLGSAGALASVATTLIFSRDKALVEHSLGMALHSQVSAPKRLCPGGPKGI